MADALVYGYTHHPAPLSTATGGLALRSMSGQKVLPSNLRRSAFEEMEEPARPDHLGTQRLGPAPELAIRGDQRDRLVGRSGHHVDERIIATALGVDHHDALDETTRDALAKHALEDDDDGLIDPP
jgi:hypothetical protein